MNEPLGTPWRIEQGRELEPTRNVPESLTAVLAKVQPILARAVKGRIPARLRSKLNPSDVIQEIFVSLHRNGVTLTDKDEKWRLRLLLKGAHYRLSNLIRYFDRAGRLPAGSEQSFETLIESGQFEETASPNQLAEPCEKLCLQEIFAALKASISTLAPLDQQIVNMRNFEFLEFSEIALRLDLKEQAVRHRFYKSLKTLKGKLSGFDPAGSESILHDSSSTQENGS